MTFDVTWYAQSAFRIDVAGLRLYHDPFQIPDGEPTADVILISHEHFDHCSPPDIARIRDIHKTFVVANPTAANTRELEPPVHVIRPGGEVQYGRLSIRAVPAYNLNKFRSPGVPFHPREKEHVGFICRAEGVTWYFAGDTDAIPEMAQFGPVDYAFLPVSGTYVMTAEEAAEAVRMLQPRVVIPMHYGTVVGSVEDARRLAALVGDVAEVSILEPHGRPS
ncbi:MAG: MBL fold metallo-hydrolase [Thermomicrobium sp.]|uniref:MBL fold metallo-hydrolase n=1 Tax=Thermomicrobium sp. TaxID=1969469 RepID=UPI001B0F1C36|nr:MBL fold metallo-hydrolase [Thermomicrobium sp.]MBO9350114.1 MBL fold metallo-hydrolase [Thermomicrobium sp.]